MSNFTQYQKIFEKERKFVDRYYDYTSKWYDFSVKYASAIAHATTESIKSFEHSKDRSIYSKQTQNQMRKIFDGSLREQIKKEDFTSSVSDYLNASLSFAEYFGIKKGYQHYMDFFSAWNKLIEPIRDNVNRSAVEVIKLIARISVSIPSLIIRAIDGLRSSNFLTADELFFLIASSIYFPSKTNAIITAETSK